MDLVIRAAVLFVFLFVVLRLIGRREMATLEPFDIILPRPLLQGEPLVLVQNGDPIQRNMRRERITVDDIMEEARLRQGVDSLDQVRWAVLETTGEISIVPASR